MPGPATYISAAVPQPSVEGVGPRSAMDRGYLAGLAGVLTLEAAGVTVQIVTGTPVPIITVAATAFVVACVLRLHGLWGTMAFVGLVFAIPYGSEFVGVLTGVPYGPYAYTGLVGPRLFGLVPFFIFIAWVNVAYMVIATTTLGLGRSSLWLAPLDGVLAAAWDVMVDPLAVRAGYWVWQGPPAFYGVPLSNFLGWILVVTLLSVLARLVWARDARAPAETSRTVAGILPALLLGSGLAFGALALASGMPYAALLGNAFLVPAVAVAWARLRRAPVGRLAPSPWTATRKPVAARAVDRL